MDNLSTTNTLLAVMAGVQVLWIVAALVAAMYVRGMVTRTETALARLQDEHVRPLRGKVDHILSKVDHVMSDVSQTTGAVQQRAAAVDASLSSTYQVAEREARRVASVFTALARETTAVATGVRAAVAAVAQPTPSTPTRGVRDDLPA
ncbi:MAG: hypothetical protein H0V80_15655 [Acidobacteria bacterium]|nr:hypothetical protein [Acidobacteriota bacterium]